MAELTGGTRSGRVREGRARWRGRAFVRWCDLKLRLGRPNLENALQSVKGGRFSVCRKKNLACIPLDMAAMQPSRKNRPRSRHSIRSRLLAASGAMWAYGTTAQEIVAPAFINEILYERSGA